MKKYVAEMMGTFAIVFCGTGAVIIDGLTNGSISHSGVAITWGLIVMTMIYTFGSNSGAHFNPAVSIAFALANRFPYKSLLPYIISQCIGAIAASALLRVLFPDDTFLGATLPAGSAMQSFILELFLSFLLMQVILHVACGSKEEGLFSGIVIGGVVGLEAMFAGPICGASMNPARSLGPALISGHTEFLWLYLMAPLTGMALAVPLFKFMKTEAVPV